MSQRVFICYARVDQAFALPLAEQLTARGVSVWIDQKQNKLADDWDRDIDRALKECTHLLIVLSPEAVDSREVRGELREFLDLGKPVLPVLYKPCEIPRQLRVVQYVEFKSRSPHDPAALNEVVRALSPLADERDALLGPDAPAPSPSRHPSSTRLPAWKGMSARAKTVLKVAAVAVLVFGGWYGLDTYTSEGRVFRDAALSPDGAYMATVSYIGGVDRVWDTRSGREAAVLSGEAGIVPAWSPDGRKLAIGTGTGKVSIYDAGTWSRSHELQGPPDDSIEFLAWSPDGSAIATGDDKGSVWVWNAGDGTLRFTKPLHTQNLVAISWTPDGTRFATASWDRSVAVVDASNGTVVKRLLGHSSFVETVAFSPDGNMLASGALESPHLIVWDSTFTRHDLEGPSAIGRLAWSPDNRYLATIGKENLVHVFDPTRDALVRRFTIAGSYISGTSLAWSPDGKRLAAGDSKGVELFDPQSDVPVGLLPDPTDATFDNVELAGWSADGSRLGTFVSFRSRARVWDVPKAAPLQTFSVGIWRALTE